jgi:hypothetical protein
VEILLAGAGTAAAQDREPTGDRSPVLA